MRPLADQLKKGMTMLAVLHKLEQGPVYAYGFRRDAAKRTHGQFRPNEGALYPLLHSLQRQGLVASSAQRVQGRTRRYYRITPKGRKALDQCRQEWRCLLRSLQTILG